MKSILCSSQMVCNFWGIFNSILNDGKKSPAQHEKNDGIEGFRDPSFGV